MKAPHRILIWLLRLLGAVTLTALGAVFMPYDWMNLIHQSLGMGELPQLPIVGYLTRSVSALYALHGALLIFVSLDVHRYLPLLRFLGWAGVAMGLVLLAVDRAVGMPAPWANQEGPGVIALSILILFLVRRVERQPPTRADRDSEGGPSDQAWPSVPVTST